MGALALRFELLTAARSVKLRRARREEMDREAAISTVPAERMKAGAEHRVMPPAEALAVMEAAKGAGRAAR